MGIKAENKNHNANQKAATDNSNQSGLYSDQLTNKDLSYDQSLFSGGNDSQTRLAASEVSKSLEKQASIDFIDMLWADNEIRKLNSSLENYNDDSAEKKKVLDEIEKFTAKREALGKGLAIANSDIEVLKNPASSIESINNVMAKQNINLTTGSSTSTTPEQYSGYRISKDGLDKLSSTVTSNMVGGNAITKEDKNTQQFGLFYYKSGASQSTSIVNGEDKSSVKTDSSKTYDVLNATYSSSKTNTESHADSSGSSIKTHSESSKIGIEGYSKTTTDSLQTDDYKVSSSKTQGIDRGDGKLGVSSTKTESVGKVNDDGELISGSSSKTSTKAGAILGASGVGAYGNIDNDYSKVHSEGVKTGIQSGANGQFTVSINEVSGTSPKKYAVVVSISLSAKLGASGSAEKKSEKADLKGSAEASIGGSASASVSFQKVLSAEETKKYLESIHMAEQGSVTAHNPELGIIATGVKNGWQAAKAMYEQTKAVAGSADGAKKMEDGDSISINLEAKGQADGKVGGSSSGYDLGVEGGINKSHGAKMTVSKVNGKVVVALAVNDSNGWNAGVKGSEGAVSMGGGYDKSNSTGREVTVTLDPNDPNYSSIFSRLQLVTSKQEIDAIVKQYPKIINSQSTSSGIDENIKGTVGIGPVGITMNQGAGVDEKTTTDSEGKVTKEYGGHNTGGMELNIGGIKTGFSDKEEFKSTVNSDGTMKADISQEKSESNFDKSLNKIVENIENDPIGLITGSAKNMESTTNIDGMKLSDKDISYLMEIAKDKTTWLKANNSPRMWDDWQNCRTEVLKAGGDKQAVAKALAKFVGTAGSGRKEILEHAVHPSADSEGGLRYEFPDGMKELNNSFEEVAVDDPSVKIKQFISENKNKEALDFATSSLNTTTHLINVISTAQNRFENPSILGEMLSRLAQRQLVLNSYFRTLTAKSKGIAITDQQIQDEDAVFRYNQLLDNCRVDKEREGTLLAQIDKYFEDHVGMDEQNEIMKITVELNKLYASYDGDYSEMAKLGVDYGFGGKEQIWRKYKPDKIRFQLAVKGKAPGEYTLENELNDRMEEKKSEEMNQYISENLPMNINARLQGEVQKAAAERKAGRAKAASIWDSQINSAKAAAYLGGAKCNGMNARGQASLIKTEANQKWGLAYSELKHGNDALKTYQMVCAHPDAVELAVENAARKVIAFYNNAITLFKEGNALQG